MRDEISTPSRRPSFGEEIANCVGHGVGCAAALVATPFLVAAAARRGGIVAIVGTSVFAGTVIALYLASTLYHALPRNNAKRVFRVIDHSAIFLLIAGTYTPFTLGVLRGAWGWILFGLVWGLAVFGVTLKSLGGLRGPRLSATLYIGMGWLALIAIRPLWLHVPVAGWLWLIAGGVAYTAGVAFYAAERLPYGYLAWHVFVLIGTTCHFCAVLWYAGQAPRGAIGAWWNTSIMRSTRAWCSVQSSRTRLISPRVLARNLRRTRIQRKGPR